MAIPDNDKQPENTPVKLMTPEEFLSYTRTIMPFFTDVAATSRAQKEWWQAQGRYWPAWCYAPEDEIAWQLERRLFHIETHQEHERFQKYITDNFETTGKEFLRTVIWTQTMAAWRMTKGIYQFHPTMYEAVIQTKLDKELPVDVLFAMPEWTVYIETPYFLHKGNVLPIQDCYEATGFFAHVTWSQANMMANLHILLPGKLPTPATIPLVPGNSLLEAILTRYPLKDEDDLNEFASILMPLASLVIYLCTKNADIGDGTTRPSNPQPTQTRKGMKLQGAVDPKIWPVGRRIGAALLSAYERDKTPAPEHHGGTHASPRPHIRLAHYHSFWTGPRASENRQLITHWIPPIPINVPDLEQLPPTIHPVQPPKEGPQQKIEKHDKKGEAQ